MAPKTSDLEPSAAETANGLVLPLQIITSGDLVELQREISDLEIFFSQQALRAAPGSTPGLGAGLKALLADNQLDIQNQADRVSIQNFLELVKSHAPVVHASFAVNPKTDFLMTLLKWFRRQAHPYTLFRIGIQPQIAAGCIFRTTNKYFDFSFKKNFADNQAKLPAAIRGVNG